MSRDLNELDPDVRDKAHMLLLAAASAGINLVIDQTYRTFDEQHILYEQGRSLPGNIVTYSPPGYSWHNWRRAFDVVFETPDGGVSWDGDWELLGTLGEHVGLEWGGRWKVPDRPHFEDRGGLTLNELRQAHPNGLPPTTTIV